MRFPNFFLVGIGSLLAFVGGAAIVVNKLENFAGYMALSGGALTGLHGWLGCEAHQQKCRTIEARYSATKLKYETLKYKIEGREENFSALEEFYSEFIASIDVK